MTIPALLRASMAYFALVFGAGFVLGAIRVTLVVPRIGVRAAELAEVPVMLVVIFLAARLVARRAPGTRRAELLAVGVLALVILVVVEFALAYGLSGETPIEYIATRDPVSGSAYAVSLLIFAVMPALQARSRSD